MVHDCVCLLVRLVALHDRDVGDMVAPLRRSWTICSPGEYIAQYRACGCWYLFQPLKLTQLRPGWLQDGLERPWIEPTK